MSSHLEYHNNGISTVGHYQNTILQVLRIAVMTYFTTGSKKVSRPVITLSPGVVQFNSSPTMFSQIGDCTQLIRAVRGRVQQ